MSDMAELLATVEQVRAEHFPDIPPDLVERLLREEAAHTDEPVTAIRELRRIINQHIKSDHVAT
mgnify:CR=1 FL=1